MSEPLWTAAEAAAATGGEFSSAWTCGGVAIDSREVGPSDLFVALKGEAADGHQFAGQALERGAGAVMVSRVPEGVADDAPLLMVEDTRAGLKALAISARRRSGARVIAVTGSVGKTGVKEALKTVLEGQGATHASVRSFNNHVGVPLSLARMPAGSQFGVFELGMNKLGEIGPLSRLVKPHVGLITTVESAHTAHFSSIEDIARSKGEIVEGLEPDGTVILNRDNPQFGLLEAVAKDRGLRHIVSFGEHGDADARLLKFRMHDRLSCVSADIFGQVITYKIGVAGRHWITNSLAVLAAAVTAGADLGLAGLALGNVTPLPGRGRRHVVALGDARMVVIDESYNASPASMRSALAAMAGCQPGYQGRRIVVLGDMLELGERASREHIGLAEPVIEASVDLVFTVGEDIAALAAALPKYRRGGHADNAEDMATLVAAEVRPGDVVMIKGSNALGLSHVVEALLRLGERDRTATGGHRPEQGPRDVL